jgi:glycosyltransferase involved in cell wall biosynthesis
MPFPLMPEGGAASKAAIGMVRGLTELGAECSVLSADARPEPGFTPPDGIDVEVFPVVHPGRWRSRWERMRRPHAILTHGPFAARLMQRARDCDVVHLVEAAAGITAGLLDGVPAATQIHCLTRRDRDIGGPWTADGRATIDLLRVERRAIAQARWLIANSEEVAEGLRARRPGVPVAVAPLSLDLDRYEPPASLEPAVAGLIGTASWPPTANAVERLICDVWPRVRAAMPAARLVLAGRGMVPATFPHLPAADGVEWRGEVESATGLLRELGVLLYPLTRGSGAKIKVLEALALGLPVVTTPEGAEGIGDGGGITIDLDDDVLVRDVLRLLGDPGARRAAGTQARETFLRHHAPAPAARPLLAFYEQMLGVTNGPRAAMAR